MYPLKFQPILKSAIWGGDKIIPYKNIKSAQRAVGESWELSGVKGDESIVANGPLAGRSITELLKSRGAELVGKANYERFGDEFPLLIKFIDAQDDLSIQVHPNDELASVRHNSKGKTEMWYVADCDKGAKLRSGFAREVSSDEYVASVEDNTITDILKEYEVEVGDTFFLPAGRVHSIGAGCFIAEIQQTSNITYRIYDFARRDAEGNTRQLHTEEAKDAIDYSVLEDYRTHYDRTAKDCEVEIVDSPYFTTSLYNLTQAMSLDLSALDSFIIFICTEGSAQITSDEEQTTIKRGETILFPASTSTIDIKPTSECKLLTTYIK